jgi:hypothetical protein
MLEGRHHEHFRVAREDVLGAVAVVHVEVEDRDSLDAMRMDRVPGCDGDVVENAETHRARARRVMPRRPHAAERVLDFALHHQVDGEYACACGMQRGRQAVRIHCRVRVEVHGAGLRRGLPDRADILDRMDPGNLGIGGAWRLVPRKILGDPRCDHLVFDCGQARGAFGVMRAHVVLEAIGMGDEGRGHGGTNA